MFSKLGRILALCNAVVAMSSFASAVAEASDLVSHAFDASAIKRLDIESGTGRVKIKGTADKTASVVARKLKFADECLLTIELKGDELVIENKEPSRLPDGVTCEVELELHLPRALIMDLAIGSGDVAIEGMAGELTYRLGSGDVVVRESNFEKIDGKTGSGDFELLGQVADVTLKIGAGDVSIVLSKPVVAGNIDLKLGTGSAVVKVPKDSRIKSSFKAGLGSLTNELGDSPDAKFTITGAAGTGDLTIGKL